MAPFFSEDIAREVFLPEMKRLVDHVHAKNMFIELHSCGQIMRQVPNMIKAGWDTWSGQSMNDTAALYEQYGDKIIIGVHAPVFDPETTSEEEQRQMARDYAAKFCNPKKPSVVAFGSGTFTDAYREELYKQSRILYAAE